VTRLAPAVGAADPLFQRLSGVQAYRVGHYLWKQGKRDLAYFVQMRVSGEIFGVDIHPLPQPSARGQCTATIAALRRDRETAVVGDNYLCLAAIRHSLGGTGKERTGPATLRLAMVC